MVTSILNIEVWRYEELQIIIQKFICLLFVLSICRDVIKTKHTSIIQADVSKLYYDTENLKWSVIASSENILVIVE